MTIENSNINARLDALETKVKELRETVQPGESPMMGVFTTVMLITFIALMTKLPLPNAPGPAERIGIGVASLIGGGIVFGIAVSVVSFTFKAIVEFAIVCLITINIAIGAVSWAFSPQLYELAAEVRVILIENKMLDPAVPDAVPFGLILAVITTGILLIDIFALLVLFPAAKIAGTNFK